MAKKRPTQQIEEAHPDIPEDPETPDFPSSDEVEKIEISHPDIETEPSGGADIPCEILPAEKTDVFATQLELGVGCSLLGMTTSMSAARGAQLKVTDHGVEAKSKSGRIVLVPWSNIRCIELVAAPKSKNRPR